MFKDEEMKYCFLIYKNVKYKNKIDLIYFLMLEIYKFIFVLNGMMDVVLIDMIFFGIFIDFKLLLIVVICCVC